MPSQTGLWKLDKDKGRSYTSLTPLPPPRLLSSYSQTQTRSRVDMLAGRSRRYVCGKPVAVPEVGYVASNWLLAQQKNGRQSVGS